MNKNNNTQLEMLVILKGGFIPILLTESEIPEIENILKEAMLKPENAIYKIKNSAINVKAILGWYYSKPLVNIQEKLVEEKDWKNNE